MSAAGRRGGALSGQVAIVAGDLPRRQALDDASLALFLLVTNVKDMVGELRRHVPTLAQVACDFRHGQPRVVRVLRSAPPPRGGAETAGGRSGCG